MCAYPLKQLLYIPAGLCISVSHLAWCNLPLLQLCLREVVTRYSDATTVHCISVARLCAKKMNAYGKWTRCYRWTSGSGSTTACTMTSRRRRRRLKRFDANRNDSMIPWRIAKTIDFPLYIIMIPIVHIILKQFGVHYGALLNRSCSLCVIHRELDTRCVCNSL